MDEIQRPLNGWLLGVQETDDHWFCCFVFSWESPCGWFFRGAKRKTVILGTAIYPLTNEETVGGFHAALQHLNCNQNELAGSAPIWFPLSGVLPCLVVPKGDHRLLPGPIQVASEPLAYPLKCIAERAWMPQTSFQGYTVLDTSKDVLYKTAAFPDTYPHIASTMGKPTSTTCYAGLGAWKRASRICVFLLEKAWAGWLLRCAVPVEKASDLKSVAWICGTTCLSLCLTTWFMLLCKKAMATLILMDKIHFKPVGMDEPKWTLVDKPLASWCMASPFGLILREFPFCGVRFREETQATLRAWKAEDLWLVELQLVQT